MGLNFQYRIPESGSILNHETSAKKERVKIKDQLSQYSREKKFNLIALEGNKHTSQLASPYVSLRKAIVRAFFPEPGGPVNKIWGNLLSIT